eukprot:TRINITY_DN1039_c4_g1_i2.p1 TRINITY_DN1039_c4_g1~~TRINITY_DN1039_c4_g1_i2.p1  ORF type:complete len:944 (+),score=113.79 TRINITY_DN1039_c4_g1_i2:126-2957(+)
MHPHLLVSLAFGTTESSGFEHAMLSDIDRLEEALDTMYVLVSAIFVFSMQVGFAFLEAGGVRSVNVITIVFKNLGDCTIGAILWWICGFSFSRPGGRFDGIIGSFEPYDGSTNIAQYLLGFMYLATATTIISGAVAERITLKAYYAITIVVSAFSYPVLVHWVWAEGGWLHEIGVIDFAGSLVVHMSSGVFAFVSAAALGPRCLPGPEATPFSTEGKSITTPHNKFLQAAGALLLWFGWFGFNTGAIDSFTKNTRGVETAAVSTLLAGSSGTIVGMITTKVIYGHLDLSHTCNALLAGLVSVTASCSFIAPWVAAAIGAGGALIYFMFRTLRFRLHVDDVIDASSVHGAAGLFGVLCVGFGDEDLMRRVVFRNDPSWSLNRLNQFGYQMIGIVAVAAWSGVLAFTVCAVMRKLSILRISQEAELQGCDGSLFKCFGYDYIGDVLHDLGPVAVSQQADDTDKVDEMEDSHDMQLLGVVETGADSSKPNKFSFLNIEILTEKIEKFRLARRHRKIRKKLRRGQQEDLPMLEDGSEQIFTTSTSGSKKRMSNKVPMMYDSDDLFDSSLSSNDSTSRSRPKDSATPIIPIVPAPSEVSTTVSNSRVSSVGHNPLKMKGSLISQNSGPLQRPINWDATEGTVKTAPSYMVKYNSKGESSGGSSNVLKVGDSQGGSGSGSTRDEHPPGLCEEIFPDLSNIKEAGDDTTIGTETELTYVDDRPKTACSTGSFTSSNSLGLGTAPPPTHVLFGFGPYTQHRRPNSADNLNRQSGWSHATEGGGNSLTESITSFIGRDTDTSTSNSVISTSRVNPMIGLEQDAPHFIIPITNTNGVIGEDRPQVSQPPPHPRELKWEVAGNLSETRCSQCHSNDWVSLRARKGTTTLKCMVCSNKAFFTSGSEILLNSCKEYTREGFCSRQGCELIHIGKKRPDSARNSTSGDTHEESPRKE